VEARVVIAADRPIHRPESARLLHVDAAGRISVRPRSELAGLLESGDVVVANDAATLPASLAGVHERSARPIELRLVARATLQPGDRYTAIVFGEGDHRTRTEHRAPPPALAVGDRLAIGALTAIVEQLTDHPRLVDIRFEGTAASIWAGLAAHGRVIQYAHVAEPLRLWDVWTSIAGPPVAYEPPSAGFILDWDLLAKLRERGVTFVTITHAAGISSTGDAELDRRLPFDEPYRIPEVTAATLERACEENRRVIAIGTTVVRALEHSAAVHGRVVAGESVATQRLGRTSRLRVVDAILSGTHEDGSSHYELLHAFAATEVLQRAGEQLERASFRTHEFGDSVLIERDTQRSSRDAQRCGRPSHFREMQVLAGAAPPRILRAFSRASVHVVQESRRLSASR
jgi:S-adenosylmethionine:tRNA ribosyltransferase-isomerase